MLVAKKAASKTKNFIELNKLRACTPRPRAKVLDKTFTGGISSAFETQNSKVRDIGLRKGSAFRPRSEHRVQNKTTIMMNK